MGWVSEPYKIPLVVPLYDLVTGDPIRPTLNCDVCGREFKTVDGLANHKREKHTSPICEEKSDA